MIYSCVVIELIVGGDYHKWRILDKKFRELKIDPRRQERTRLSFLAIVSISNPS
jgi:hypothetical protein